MDQFLIKNCEIIDMITEKSQFKEMLIEKGRIKKIEEPGVIKCSNTLNLNGATILPGFMDSHIHLMASSIDAYSINLESATCIDDILSMIQEKRHKNPDLNVIIGRRLAEFSLKEGRLPTKEELDQVANDIPVFLSSREYHTVTVNSFVLHQLNLPLSLSQIIRNKKGHPTGQMVNHASIIARKKMYEMFSDYYMQKGLKKTYQDIVSHGITSLISIEGGYLFHNKHVDFLVKNKLDYPIDIDILFSTTDVNKVKVLGFNKIGGDIFWDGSFTSRNARISEDYSDSPGQKGKLFFSQEEIEELIGQCIEENLQISIHAVGNIGIKRLIDAYESVYKKYPKKDYRHKIEHFELPDKEDIQRVKDLGLVLTMHPSYEGFYREAGEMYDQRLGKKRALLTNPLREIFDAGIPVAAGSDSNILPVNPLVGVHSAVNHPNELSRISVFDALKMYTINGAYGNKEEHIKGTIEQGKIADFVVLEKNPLKIESSKIKDIRILMTIKNGKVIYQSGESI